MAAAVGELLAGHIAAECHDQSRPPVFRRAAALLAHITRGRYQLDLAAPDGAAGVAEPAFRAIDTTSRRGHALHELSSGTRVQLLLAVRLAFLEELERHAGGGAPRLPLVLDEVLADSDDERAAAIIETVLELCASGRQVFYMTAQSDEVHKWQAMLRSRPGVPHRAVDLAELRELQAAGRDARLAGFAWRPSEEPPAPGGMSAEQYGRALGVPPLDPRADIGAAHLWHVFAEPAALAAALRLRVAKFGELAELARAGAAPGVEPADWERALASARVLEEAARQWRRGRGKPVDRATLMGCERVTDRFLNDLTDLAAGLGGDAAALIAALRARHIKGFREQAIDALERHLEESGHLDRQPRRTPEEARLEVMKLAAEDVRAGRIDPRRIEQLIARLPWD
jgi:hypothetical protein